MEMWRHVEAGSQSNSLDVSLKKHGGSGRERAPPGNRYLRREESESTEEHFSLLSTTSYAHPGSPKPLPLLPSHTGNLNHASVFGQKPYICKPSRVDVCPGWAQAQRLSRQKGLST